MEKNNAKYYDWMNSTSNFFCFGKCAGTNASLYKVGSNQVVFAIINTAKCICNLASKKERETKLFANMELQLLASIIFFRGK